MDKNDDVLNSRYIFVLLFQLLGYYCPVAENRDTIYSKLE
jgi:hypothetical protein